MFDAAIDHAIESRLADAAAAAEAAILIFRHSVLDYVATELCRVLGTLAPRLWEDALGERRLKLSDVNSFGSYEDALRGLVSTYMDEIERKSLVCCL
jgi:hypothetical protein